MKRLALLLAVVAFGVVSCDTSESPLASDENEHNHSEATLGKHEAAVDFSPIVAMVDGINAEFAAQGSETRLDYPWLFRVGKGVDPFMQLRTGTRWITQTPAYIFDVEDYTTDVPFGDVDAALENAYGTWNAVKTSTIFASRQPEPVPDGNYDVLDGTFAPNGDCVHVLDFSSDILIGGQVFPVTDIVVGGWLDADYFEKCLGDPDILGVTWTFFGADANNDNYQDRLYVEQFYNDGFDWTTTDAVYLDFDAPIDIETVALHENGHAHGLGHFGGPVRNQQLTLKPNGRVFNPTAVMNGGYLGGEERTPLHTDKAAITTLYGRKGN